MTMPSNVAVPARRRLIMLVVSVGLLISVGCRRESSGSGSDPTQGQTETIRENPSYTSNPRMTGYVSAVTLSVRSEPGTASTVVGFLFKGDRVDVYETADVSGATWYQVNDEAGYVDGWVSGRFISGRPIASDFIVPADYGRPVTPTTLLTDVTAQYVGIRGCIRCHSETDRAGEFPRGAYGVWRDHYHADAYRTLSRPYTRALARRRGVNDPTTDSRCVKCHVAAYGVPASRLGPNYRHEDGVTCEVCHGPGGDYLLNHWEGTDGFESREAMGFRVYRSIEERDRVCRSCHNTLSPTYKPFNVAAFSSAIRHWGGEYNFVEVAREEDVATTRPEPVARAADPPQDPEPPAVTTPATDPPRQQPERARPPEVVTPPADPPARAEPAERTPPPPADPPAAASASDDGPNEMMLDEDGRRGRVFFPHRDHHTDFVSAQGGVGECQVCHHTTEAAEPVDEGCRDCHEDVSTDDTPNAEKAFHNSCRACHREEQAGPTKCSQCHERGS